MTTRQGAYGLTDQELRASPVPITGSASSLPVTITGSVTTGGLTDAELRASRVPIFSTDFFIDIVSGSVSGHEIDAVAGRNPSVGLVFEDIWDAGALSTLNYDAQTGNFTPGLVLSGGTSLATAVIVTDEDAGAAGTLTLRKISGIFQTDETITDSSIGSATSNGVVDSLKFLDYPTAGERWEVICESAADTAAGINARTVLIKYLDSSFVEKTETVTLSGQTAALMVETDAFRHRSTSVSTWGNPTADFLTKSNAGTIIIRDSVTKKIRSSIPFDDSLADDAHGLNATRDSHYTVPVSKKIIPTFAAVNSSKNHEAEIILLVRPAGIEGFSPLGQRAVYQTSINFDLSKATRDLAAGTDIKFVAKTNNNSVPVNTGFGFVVVNVS